MTTGVANGRPTTGPSEGHRPLTFCGVPSWVGRLMRSERDVRGAVFHNVGNTVTGWSGSSGPNIVTGGTRGEQVGERPPRGSDSRSECEIDDSASCGRAGHDVSRTTRGAISGGPESSKRHAGLPRGAPRGDGASKLRRPFRWRVALPGNLWLESTVQACTFDRVPGTAPAHSLVRPVLSVRPGATHPAVAGRWTAGCLPVGAHPVRAPERLNTLFALPVGMSFRARRGCAPTRWGIEGQFAQGLRGRLSIGEVGAASKRPLPEAFPAGAPLDNVGARPTARSAGST